MNQPSPQTMDTLLEFYLKLLSSVNVTSDDNAALQYHNYKAVTAPAMVYLGKDRKLPMVLPIASKLQENNWTIQAAFHPLSENIIRDESEVLAQLRRLMATQVYMMTTVIGRRLLTVLSSKDKKDLTPKKAALLRKIPNATAETVKNFGKVMEMMFDQNRQFLTLFIRWNGKLGDDHYQRLCVANFPERKKLAVEDGKYDTLTLPVKDKKAIHDILDYIFPNFTVEHAFSAGSNESVAPAFHALLLCWEKLINALNNVLYDWEKELHDVSPLDDTWCENISKLPQFRGIIVGLPYNEGVGGREMNTAAEDQQQIQSAPVSRRQSVVGRPQGPSLAEINAKNPVQQPQARPAPATQSGYGQTYDTMGNPVVQPAQRQGGGFTDEELALSRQQASMRAMQNGNYNAGTGQGGWFAPAPLTPTQPHGGGWFAAAQPAAMPTQPQQPPQAYWDGYQWIPYPAPPQPPMGMPMAQPAMPAAPVQPMGAVSSGQRRPEIGQVAPMYPTGAAGGGWQTGGNTGGGGTCY